MKRHLTQLLNQSLLALRERGTLDIDLPTPVQIERTRDPAHGDLASNIALTLAGQAGMNPRDLAQRLCDNLPDSERLLKTEIAGPGFINFFLGHASLQSIIETVLTEGDRFGCTDVGAGRAVQVEFVSANPTGPLHVGHGRGAAVGDSIARLLEATGWNVTREFYYNDAGRQIDNLALSVQARCCGLGPDHSVWPDDGYRGEYIVDVARAYMAGQTVEASDRRVTGSRQPENLEAIRDFAVAYLRREQDLDLQSFAVGFDVFFLESSLYDAGAVEDALSKLLEQGHTYEKDGALWLRTTDFGDDKDRVMRKRGGGYTYFLPDVAYHHNKWQRGFTRVINEQGSDHHGTIARVRAGLQAMNVGIPPGWPDYVLHQMVTVVRNGKEVKISKRAGSYVTLGDLIEEVGCDATRYFLAARAPGSQLTFDIDLALSQSHDNPVYYIQYAHARACSVFRKLAAQQQSWTRQEGLAHLNLLAEDRETAIMKKLAQYPELVARAARRFEPHSVAAYLRELAGEFHTWYNAHKMLVDDEGLRSARLALASAVRQVIHNGLSLLGVSAPESM